MSNESFTWRLAKAGRIKATRNAIKELLREQAAFDHYMANYANNYILTLDEAKRISATAAVEYIRKSNERAKAKIGDFRRYLDRDPDARALYDKDCVHADEYISMMRQIYAITQEYRDMSGLVLGNYDSVEILSSRMNFVMDALLPPSRVGEIAITLEDLYKNRWMRLYGSNNARLICWLQIISVVISYRGRSVAKLCTYVGGFIGIKCIYAWLSRI